MSCLISFGIFQGLCHRSFKKNNHLVKNLKLPVLLSLLMFFQFLNVAVSSGPVNDDLQKAKNLFQKGEYEEAISMFEKFAKTDDKHRILNANVGLTWVYIQKGEYEKAQKVSEKTLKMFPQNAAALTLQGKVFNLTGNYKNARLNFRKALEQNPDELSARLNLGVMQWEWGQKTVARQTLQYFVDYYRSQPNLTGGELQIIAQACIYLDRFRDANNLFTDATEMDKNLWQAYIPWGELFLSKYNIPDAQGVFDDALQINPNAAEALLGLAKCLSKSNFENAITMAEKALAINPNLVAVHDFLAELEITLGNYDGALDILDKPLRTNPNSLSSRTLRAICFFFMKKMSKFAEEEQRILAINPKYSYLYYQTAEVLSKRYLFKESVEYYEKALELDPENWAARAGLGTSLSRLGKEEAAKQELEKAFAKDPFNKYVGNLLTLFDEFPQYKTHQTKHFTIRIHEKDDAVLSTYAKQLVEESFAALNKKYPFDTQESVVLEIFPEHDDFAVRCFGLPGAQAFLGICFGNLIAMDSPRARTKGDFVWGQTLWHELVHVTHLKMTANRIPRWLAEGIAVYETAKLKPHWQMGLDVPFISAFKSNRTLPLKDLDSGFNRPTNPGQVTLSYFQASLIVEFIVEKYGQQKLLAMFPKFKAGLGTNQVIEEVFGKNVNTFDEEFKLFVVQKYKLDEIDYSYDPREFAAHSNDLVVFLSKKLEENSSNPFLNFQFGMYYKKEGDFETAIPYFQKAKSQFPNFIEEENPYKALAEIYIETGEKSKAIKELSALTALKGKDARVLNLLADLCLESNNNECAVEALTKAIYITPFEPEVHQKLASAYLALGEFEQAITELQINLHTEPQDLAGAHCDLASAFLKADRKPEAKKSALAALEIAPSYERAQEILLASME
ncbi:MAG: tetratricopeptide repeat protein [Caldithrix sp.]|nr:MAG: tetratricopeptide repeat protein [Caldithrix sp.]